MSCFLGGSWSGKARMKGARKGGRLTQYSPEKARDTTRMNGTNARKKVPPNVMSCLARGIKPCIRIVVFSSSWEWSEKCLY